MSIRTYQLNDWARAPAKGVVVRDSLFGTEIVRVTGNAVDHYPDAGIANEYARSDPENSDGTLVVLRGNAANWQLYNARSFARIRTLTALGRGGQEPEPRWDPKDPSVLYHLRNMRLLSLNVRTGAQGTEGDSSLDRRWWCFRVQDRDYAAKELVMYDRQRDLFEVNPAIGMHISGNAAVAPGWVLVSTSGPLNPPRGARHSWMDRQLFMLELRRHPRVWRVAQTRTLESINPDDQKHYFAEAFAAITTRGTRIYWGSNWSQQDLEHTHVYAAILPTRWWQQLPPSAAATKFGQELDRWVS